MANRRRARPAEPKAGVTLAVPLGIPGGIARGRGRGVAVVRVQNTAAIFQNGGSAGGWARWTAELLRIDDFPKKDPTNFFQDNAARSSLNEDRLLGNIKNVAITDKKEQFVGKRFKATEMVEAVQIYKT
ncbi:peptidyl-prolyl cis-trans isomerase FKBP3-like [Stigmatopora argus]